MPCKACANGTQLCKGVHEEEACSVRRPVCMCGCSVMCHCRAWRSRPAWSDLAQRLTCGAGGAGVRPAPARVQTLAEVHQHGTCPHGCELQHVTSTCPKEGTSQSSSSSRSVGDAAPSICAVSMPMTHASTCNMGHGASTGHGHDPHACLASCTCPFSRSPMLPRACACMHALHRTAAQRGCVEVCAASTDRLSVCIGGHTCLAGCSCSRPRCRGGAHVCGPAIQPHRLHASVPRRAAGKQAQPAACPASSGWPALPAAWAAPAAAPCRRLQPPAARSSNCMTWLV